MKPLFRLHQVALETYLDASGAEVLGDPSELGRALQNLVENGIRYSPRDGTLRVSVTACQTELVEVRVEDRGPGVPDARKEQIFSAFAEPGSEDRSSGGRTNFGLGLSAARQIIDAHGGKVWVEDNVPGGAVFVVHLPAARRRAQVGQPPAPLARLVAEGSKG